ncbi:N-acetylmuramoyl-L-alanine amidase [Alteromonas sp. C1M14]|uniref:N-acetylmuramoyl-L-alanine amidase n=1 Tax=Alteromonas sp. C1M14 TaxID=2841567 RepID=UPI001C08824C|nr:N-acetylmuramoyl-L-alanine amidase [Alteromonas sp. C1M14]MBU2980133.1 N-acetylmuramoyl-L-alanine amidase [Alteromonas sp. C1M14]
MVRIFVLTICVWCLALPVWSQNQISGVRAAPSGDKTRVVLDVQAAPEYTYFTLDNPNRLVIDLANTSTKSDLSQADISGSLVKKVRYSTPKNPQSARIVVELARKATPTLFPVEPDGAYGHRLVVDLLDSNPPSTSRQASVVLDAGNNSRDRDIIVAIDAGHGGNDPGSIGRAGTYEKHITLSIAKYLEKLVNNEPGMRAVMTRSGDYYVGLNKRPEIARKSKADLLISIHADAFTAPGPRGGSVWVLSMRRADTELGRWLERSERHSELLGGAAEVISDNVSERYLAETILGLSMDHSMSTSYDLSRKVISEMKSVTKMHKGTPQAASLAVLTAPDIPSILVETGFISNPQEEKNLNWSTYRQKLANSIFTAVKSYFRQVPPDGTLWASQKMNNRTHKVRSGESLSLLAQRYNVKISSLKAVNNLRSDTVRIGQVLTIPRT